MEPVLYYQEVRPGDASASRSLPPLVIVHGLFGSGDNWMKLARRFAGQRRVFLVDLPNHGCSKWTERADYHASARELAATLERIRGREFSDDEEFDGFLLLGHSMGGKAVMVLALSLWGDLEPPGDVTNLLSGIVIADIAPVEYPRSHDSIFNALENLPLEKLESRQDADRELKQSLPSGVLRAFLLKNLYRDDRDRFAWKLNLNVLHRDYPEILGFPDPGNRVSTLPALFLRGSESDYIVPEEHRSIIWRLFPRARMEEVSGAGHWLHAEQPEKVYNIIMEQ
ncbi:alpha/beta fold hydrolase [Salinispira pacifica]|uniref:Hydrolase, alpha/beta fold family n=1 Tax=Salinispira pacifica TaxID=1307761 RepID=V5WD97_9SPIO|nr:alpha/beta fold hydrolase [Salinispira pacifica]AHC13772.1 Hydrolase, alpha/beta fold family [Salinispira pacifica]